MEPTGTKTAVNEHEELVDMRTHLTVAMLAAAQLRRATHAVPDAERFDAYLQQALDHLRDDVQNVESLVLDTEAATAPPAAHQADPLVPERRTPLLLRLPPIALARWVAGCVVQYVQRRRLTRMNLLTAQM